MQARQLNRAQYFKEQAYTTKKYVIPFIESVKTIDQDSEILEIGCGDGGNMEPFLDLGCKVVGVDPVAQRIKDAADFFSGHLNRAHLRLIQDDIYNLTEKMLFDVIIIRDVLEHIHNQERFMAFIKRFLKPDGVVFLGFPPWQNPFGGHQQICAHPVLSRLPFFHLLPEGAYVKLLKSVGESEKMIQVLLEIRQTRITIERFSRILKHERYHVLKRELYFINPNYEVKFGLKPRRQPKLIASIPYLRNFFTTTCYYMISFKKEYFKLQKHFFNYKG